MRLEALVYFVLNVDRPEWQEFAACRGLGPELFFVEKGDEAHLQLKKAREICATCPVFDQCLTFALSFQYKSLPGIWAGTSENQRRAMLYSDTPVR